jgi:hypothetical protein
MKQRQVMTYMLANSPMFGMGNSEKADRGVLSSHQVQNITQSESQKPTFEKINYIYETRRPKEF